MQLEGKLLPSPGADPSLPTPNRGPRSGARWLQRRFYRYQPGAVLGLFGVLVGVPLALDLFVVPVRDWLDGQATQHEVGVNLLEHVLVAGLVAAAAYYWVLGLKRQKALKSYRSRARNKPWELVEWSHGKPPVVRRAVSKLLADGIERNPEPAVAVVQGRTGTGRTSFVVGLVEDLAKQNLIPIPVLARRDGSFALEDLAREVFCRHIDDVLSSDQQADAIWHRARATRDIVILVDGLDDEVVGMLWRDRGSRFQQTVKALHDQRIAVVFATTSELPLGDIAPVREDLDLFSRDEANNYVQKALKGTSTEEVTAALEQLHDPVDDTLVAPFYLDLLVRLQKAGISLHNLPEQTDPWRAAVLATYVDSIHDGKIVPTERSGDPDDSDPHTRGLAAERAAMALARGLTERADLTVTRKRLKISDYALDDADELNLLWRGTERVGFAGDDLGAYLLARTVDDPSQLLKDVSRVAQQSSSKRLDRHALLALIFWHLEHEGRERAETFDRLLTAVTQGQWTRPAVVAAVVRIASSCELTDFSPRVAEAVRSCVHSLDNEDKRTARPRQAGELLRLVRALAEWRDPEAHRLLWNLATNRNIEVEWPAAKALAMATDRPGRTLESDFEDVLRQAERQSEPAAMSDPGDQLGNKVASLAWILPALREDERVEEQLSRVTSLCLQRSMSPLRGEMSLAQGLKFAIVNERMAPRNVDDVRHLLFELDGGVRFWHVRLVLVQALLAHAWKHREHLDELKKQLGDLRAKEAHPLVKHGIELARHGVRELTRSSNGNDPPLGRYMWTHERDAVKWVEQGKPSVTQLAADVVLLSNMTYRLRTQDAPKADRIAADSALPRCIRKSSDRHNITRGCQCAHGLCREQDPPAVLATRARFSESFCREQARLVKLLGPPSWTKRGIVAKRSLKKFWDDQASISQSGSARPGA